MDIRELIDLCADRELINCHEAQTMLTRLENQTKHPIIALLQWGIDEKELYHAFSEESRIPLYRGQVKTPEPIPEKTLAYLKSDDLNSLDCLILGMANERIQVITWNWFNTKVIPQNLKNLTQKEIDLYLATPNQFNSLG